MKVTRHVCDFCGGDMGQDGGKLLVPQLPKPRSQDQDSVEGLAGWVGFSFISSGPKAKEYDVCRPCAEGLLNNRWAKIRRLAEAVEAGKPVGVDED